MAHRSLTKQQKSNPLADAVVAPAAPVAPIAGSSDSLTIVILGLSITSAWGNGHATTYRALVRALSHRGHEVLFLERDVPWYAANRDLPEPPYGRTALYADLPALKDRWLTEVSSADLVIVGSYVPEGVAVGRWVTQVAQGITAFYDIDTPVTLAKLARGDEEYIAPDLIPRYDLYLSFSGGAVLETLKEQYGAPCARPLYCSVDPLLYFPAASAGGQWQNRWRLGYMGTYSDDRQPGLNELLLKPAARLPEQHFVVAGPNYPALEWGKNVERIEHLPPHQHRDFYNQQHFTLNLTRSDMVRAGHSPSVRLFEAAACGTPIISDYWEGLDEFFAFDEEILVARTAADVVAYLHDLDADQRQLIGARARAKVLAHHTAEQRAQELERYVTQQYTLSSDLRGR